MKKKTLAKTACNHVQLAGSYRKLGKISRHQIDEAGMMETMKTR